VGLIACANCGNRVNSEASGCPSCGANPQTGVMPERVVALAPQETILEEAVLLAILDNDAGTLPGTYGAARQITYADGEFDLERDGPIAARDVLQYDREGRVTWVDEGLREWVGRIVTAKDGVDRVGFIWSLVGFLAFLLTIPWIVGLVVSRREIRNAKREHRPHGLSTAGFWISAIMLSLAWGGVLVSVVLQAISG
jgi:RNA polymerase subunit RPABC4/transcription elongation factor Spt4